MKKSKEIRIGKVKIGAKNSIKIQSMTNTKTADEKKSILQIQRLFDLGCDIVRLGVKNKKEVFSLEKIKNTLLKKNIDIPIIADVHFCPKIAKAAIEFADKIRINPDNFSKNLEKDFLPLLEKCAYLKKPIRIGVNQGSIAKSYLLKNKDIADLMVKKVLYYIKVCEENKFYNLVISLKSSNIFIVQRAYKTIFQKMGKTKYFYPLHLGITEAGEGMEARIKSTIAIGPLLLDGIGDTFRISLTEDPEKEVIFAKELLSFCKKSKSFKNFSSLLKKRKSNIFNKNFLAIANNKKFDIKNSLLDGFLDKDKVVIKGTSFFNFQTVSNAKELLKNKNSKMIFFDSKQEKNEFAKLKSFFSKIFLNKIKTPILLKSSKIIKTEKDLIKESLKIYFLIEKNLIQGICFSLQNIKEDNFYKNLLQVCKKKIFKPEYISCPGCSRTNFDIQKMVKRIKEKTQDIKGIKIAIMGCIVNGIGEIQNADFGILAEKEGFFSIYEKGKKIFKNLDFLSTEKKFIELIRK